MIQSRIQVEMQTEEPKATHPRLQSHYQKVLLHSFPDSHGFFFLPPGPPPPLSPTPRSFDASKEPLLPAHFLIHKKIMTSECIMDTFVCPLQIGPLHLDYLRSRDM